jgi:glycosyltransferase involved in cell wall biosynthesis
MSEFQISAVIPTYNRGHLVGRAIKSALQQIPPPTEIIVVDDGSQDHTREQVLRFGDAVRYIYQENGGSAAARHNGFLSARYAWVALLDSDDIWSETHLERVRRAMQATDGIARFYFADTLRSSEGGGRRNWEIAHFRIDGEHQLMLDAADWVMLGHQPMMLQATVFNRDAYFACGGFWRPLRYRDDTHLFLKLGLGGPACAVNNLGCQMTDDDQQNRLTTTYQKAKNGCWTQVLMNQDLLTRDLLLKPTHRREIRRRLAVAHRGMARFALADGQWLTAVAHLSTSLMIQPQAIFSRL